MNYRLQAYRTVPCTQNTLNPFSFSFIVVAAVIVAESNPL